MNHQAAETKPVPAGFNLKMFASILRRVWPYMKPQWKHMLVLLGLYFLIPGTIIFEGFLVFDLFNNKVLLGEPLDSAQATAFMLDSSYVETDALTDEQRRVVRNRTLIYALMIAVLFIVVPTVVVTPYYAMWIMQRVNQHLRVTMIERAEHLSLRYHSHARTGDAIYRVFQDSSMITEIIINWIAYPIVQAIAWPIMLVVLLLFSPVLGLICIIASVPILWLVAWYTPRLQRRARLARQAHSDLTSRIQEASAAMRVMKANQAEATVMDRFDRDSNAALDSAFMLRLEMIFMRTAIVFIGGAVIIAVTYLMAGWILNEESTWRAGVIALVGITTWNLGAYQAVRITTDAFFGDWQLLVMMWSTAQDMAMGLDRAFFLLDLEPDVVDAEDAVSMPAPIREVAYSNLHFAYEADRPVLQGVNLEAPAGTVTAIVGATGSGKSTLMCMLLRLYDPDEGALTVNGADLKGIRIDDLRGNVAIALQQNVLFATTVAENIGYATRNASRQAIEAAAKIACAHTFIETMEKGYDTERGERGGKLSTGERQRLTIARAIVRDTPILILDEPTAALDAETELQVLENLARWGRERVLFLITHRLSTIRSADQIAFLEDGRIVEVGDHDTLMARPGGRYRNFVLAETEGSDTGKEAAL